MSGRRFAAGRSTQRAIAWSLASLIVLTPGAAWAFDYPTVDRVEYVRACIRDNAGPEQEMIYKCSCLIDAIARQMSYEEYVDASTAANAYTIGGERGETVRAYAPAKAMSDRFKEVVSRAKKSCFFR